MRWGDFKKNGNSYRGSIEYPGYRADITIAPGLSKRGCPFRVLVDGVEIGDAEWMQNNGMPVYLFPPQGALTVTFRLMRDAGDGESFGLWTMDN